MVDNILISIVLGVLLIQRVGVDDDMCAPCVKQKLEMMICFAWGLSLGRRMLEMRICFA